MLPYYVLGGAVFILLILLYFGVFNKVEILESKFPQAVFVYLDFQGSINKLQPLITQLRNNIPVELRTSVHIMTIQYDDPFNLVVPGNFRASVGYLIPKDDSQSLDILHK